MSCSSGPNRGSRLAARESDSPGRDDDRRCRSHATLPEARQNPALHETDCDGRGFEWIDCQDAAQSIISFYRYSIDRTRVSITVCNLTPVIRSGYRIGVDAPGRYAERLNTDAEIYGGSGQGNGGEIIAREEPQHERPCSLVLTLPPLGVLVLERSR